MGIILLVSIDIETAYMLHAVFGGILLYSVSHYLHMYWIFP